MILGLKVRVEDGADFYFVVEDEIDVNQGGLAIFETDRLAVDLDSIAAWLAVVLGQAGDFGVSHEPRMLLRLEHGFSHNRNKNSFATDFHGLNCGFTRIRTGGTALAGGK